MSSDNKNKDIGTAAAIVFRATFVQEIRNKRYSPDAEERLVQYVATFVRLVHRGCKSIMASVYGDSNTPILEGVVMAVVESLSHERLLENMWFPVTSDDPVPPHIGDQRDDADLDTTIRFDTYWPSAKGPFVRLFGPNMDAVKAAYNNIMTHAWLFRDALNAATFGEQSPIGRIRVAQVVVTPGITIMHAFVPFNGLPTATKLEIQRKIAKERAVDANPVNNAFGFVSNSDSNSG